MVTFMAILLAVFVYKFVHMKFWCSLFNKKSVSQYHEFAVTRCNNMYIFSICVIRPLVTVSRRIYFDGTFSDIDGGLTHDLVRVVI